jgi:hypothetical protein
VAVVAALIQQAIQAARQAVTMVAVVAALEIPAEVLELECRA